MANTYSQACVLDILRHLPRCAFSERQNAAIEWAMRVLGLHYVPSQRTMKDVERALQQLCGVDSIRYSGALGHVYYANDFARLIAQEVGNPWVRPHLKFLPEDSGSRLSEAWQAKRWLDEMDPDLLTQMIQVNNQDFYIYEPALLAAGDVCMPVRWFTRGDSILARAHPMSQTARGWIVHEHSTLEVNSNDLLLSFPQLIHSHQYDGLPDPRVIQGSQQIKDGALVPWTRTDPTKGNEWRAKANGHRVLAFPIWLYCDDTSGNVSKKWNKHNSFLFTAAGLPRRFVHREFNVHFLSTSNLAPPLEMLDGIVDQLRECQRDGVWAWDAEYMEMVLLIPSVLAMLGDNPMQSEIACHIGLMGKLFCRVCWVSSGTPDHDESELDGDADDQASDASSLNSATSDNAGPRKKSPETLAHMVDRVKRFMQIDRMRTRSETRGILASHFAYARQIGGQNIFKAERTRTGIKDTFQMFFTEKLFKISVKRGCSRVQKEADIEAAETEFPTDITSPVWRIKDFDPHSDTPVEILHVILLGFVKYLWRDAISRLKDPQKAVLIARLNSFNVSGLGIPKLAGSTLVTYSGSLTGRDFRAIAQAAPFVLHDLLAADALAVWQALGVLVPLVWKPEIEDIHAYLPQLEKAIQYFLDCTCRLTPRWFNKPKFHIVLHLPEHIRHFGPAMLFATEGFESYNAIIRSHSVLSNRHAPSRDIARSMAGSNRVRHLLCGGFFPGEQSNYDQARQAPLECDGSDSRSTWIAITHQRPLDHWRSIGLAPRELLEERHFSEQMLGFPDPHEDQVNRSKSGTDMIIVSMCTANHESAHR
ncbi:hypothetical protein OE88DRAFT_1638675 [Heliocybe sulcata]|uniref:Uncharacterized protein n=1 Tax=Heliocybe sulcata TaxID=5364 RepID=A0A5C3MP63_9AGAM|nr:hypothetical protein OE88DRAFT_1638675 [Heliocybe sulcata]